MKDQKPVVGFIGQGWIGKHYADVFERRGFTVVRYSLEKPFFDNKEAIKDCAIVFIAVPTPTTPRGFDGHIVEGVLPLVGTGATAVIKSTVLPGTTKRLQKRASGRTIVYSPEFLSEATAAHDAAHPFSNIIGLPARTARHRAAAKRVLAVLPKAPFRLVCDSTEAEIIKYTHNASGYAQVVLFNLMYDLSRTLDCDWSVIHSALAADPMICNRYSQPVHKNGRGAGGGCFIKDLAALRELYEKRLSGDKKGAAVLRAMERKNIDLLTKSGKDRGLLRGVYGKRPRA